MHGKKIRAPSVKGLHHGAEGAFAQDLPELVAGNGLGPPLLHHETPRAHGAMLRDLARERLSYRLAAEQALRKFMCKRNSVAFCSPAKSLTFSGLMENPLVGKK